MLVRIARLGSVVRTAQLVNDKAVHHIVGDKRVTLVSQLSIPSKYIGQERASKQILVTGRKPSFRMQSPFLAWLWPKTATEPSTTLERSGR